MSTSGGFIGRAGDLARLQQHLDAVAEDGRGRLLSVRGRRQSGKSRLVTEFADRSGLPQVFFTASRLAGAGAELARLVQACRESSLPAARQFDGIALTDWHGAFQQIAAALPDGPAIVVLDEFPWLAETSPSLEGTMQTVWDRAFEAKPVLLVLIGSDLRMMEALSSYDRPLFGRLKEMVVEPFTIADTASMIGVDDDAVAIDAQLVTGGYPRLCLEWRGATDVESFLDGQLADENSDLVVIGRNVLAAEFPAPVQARQVLAAIGAGSRTNKAISAAAGIQAAPLARSLRVLAEDKRVIAAEVPTSIRRPRDPRYGVADPYLRFWLRFVEPALSDLARGRGDLVRVRVRDSWLDYRGRAVEPLVRSSLERLAARDPRLSGVGAVGGYWTRAGGVEVDIVGVDRWPGATQVGVVGSIKWREQAPFDRRDLADLAASRAEVPGGADAAMIAVSRSGCVVSDLAAVYGPADLVAAWR